MAFCTNCGKKVEGGGRFCQYCGAELKGNGQQPGQYQGSSPNRDRNAVVPILIAGMVCMTVVVVVIGVAVVFSMGRAPKDAEPSRETPSALETGQDVPSVTPEITQEPQEPQETPAGAESGDPPLKEWPEQDTLPFSTEKFRMELPGTWADHYRLEKGDGYYAFYNVENADAGYGGFLFSVETYQTDGEWEYLPSYLYLGEKDGAYYVATFPTDVQFDIEDEGNQDIYRKMSDEVDAILETFVLK